MRVRQATTLTEVLIAIFVMAIGMMSLLSLFPVGALSMAQAIRDERAAQAAANAAAIAEARGLRHDPLVNYWFDEEMSKWDTMDPTRYLYSLVKNTLPPYDGPSYPIFVDPLGVKLGAGPLGKASSQSLNMLLGIPRTDVSYARRNALNFQALYGQSFTLLDDITYVDPATNSQYGVPTVNPLIDPVQREGRHSWAYLIRRPRFRDHSVVDVTILVYNARSQIVPLGEQVFFHPDPQNQVKFIANSNVVRVPWRQMGLPTKPDIRKGQWIMDATMQKRDPTTNAIVPDPHGYFYRVVNVIDNGAALILELQTPPKADTITNPFSVMVFMEGLVEVFDKGAGWQP